MFSFCFRKQIYYFVLTQQSLYSRSVNNLLFDSVIKETVCQKQEENHTLKAQKVW